MLFRNVYHTVLNLSYIAREDVGSSMIDICHGTLTSMRIEPNIWDAILC